MIEIYFGAPGCGKTTILAQLAHKMKKKYKYIYSNCEDLLNARYISPEKLNDLGNITLPEYSLLLIDEAGIEFNNRNYKGLPKNLIYYAKMHRHYRIDIIMFSQSFTDMDITFRRLANTYYRVKRCGPFSLSRRIRPFLHIDEEKKEIVDGYEFYPFFRSLISFVKPFNLCYRPRYYKYFDSWARIELPIFYS